MDIQTTMRAQDVTRWNIVHTIRKQSLAEHSFNVAMIARQLCEMMEVNSLVNQVTECALFHDLDEIITGDIPSPTKIRAKAKGLDLNHLIEGEQKQWPEPIKHIVKLADLVENVWYISVYGHGRHARQVELKLVAEIDQLYPSDATVVRQVLYQMLKGDIAI